MSMKSKKKLIKKCAVSFSILLVFLFLYSCKFNISENKDKGNKQNENQGNQSTSEVTPDGENELNLPFSIKYELNGGQWINDFEPKTSSTSKEVLTLPDAQNIQKAGYSFWGWVLDPCIIDKKLTSLTGLQSSEVVLYAIWVLEIPFENLITVLDSLPENTVENPYYLRILNVNTKTLNDVVSILRDCKSQGDSPGQFFDLTPTDFNPTMIFNINLDEDYYRSINSVVAIKIPDGVSIIPDYCLEDWESVQTIVMPESISEIGSSAFYNCESLKNLEIPHNVQTIGSYAFEDCVAIETIIIPENVTVIERGLFYRCENLSNVVLGRNTTSLQYRCFYSCENLETIYLPAKLSEISEDVFEESGIKNLEISPENNYFSIKDKTLYSKDYSKLIYCYDTTITTYYVSDSVHSINNGAFYSCKDLQNVYIPSSVSEITSPFLWDIKAIYTTAEIVEKVKDCYPFCYFYLPDDSVFMSDQLKERIRFLELLAEKGTQRDFRINQDDEEIYEIPESFFSGNDIIETIFIEKDIFIDSHAFENCSKLTSVRILGSVTDYVFANCKSLISVDINWGWVSDTAFEGCDNLERINFPNYEQARNFYERNMNLPIFYNGKPFRYIDFEQYRDAEVVTLSPDLELDIIPSRSFDSFSNLKKIIIPEGVTVIGNDAFSNCINLEEVVLPQSLTSLNDSAFRMCQKLKKIIIPDNVTDIGYGVFSDCSALEEVVFPSSWNGYVSNILYGCYNLKKITASYGTARGIRIDNPDISLFFPDGSPYVDFEELRNSTVVNWPSELHEIPDVFRCDPVIEKIIIPEGVTSICNSAFEGCINLREVVLPTTLKSIGNYVFASCSSLQSIEIPHGITEIKSGAFANCHNLESIAFPDTLELIEPAAFYSCSSISEIIFNSYVTGLDNSLLINNPRIICTNQNFAEKLFWLYPECTIVDLYGNSPDVFARKTIEVPEYITSIPEEQFKDFVNLEIIILHDKIESIGSRAFSGCINLKSLVIPESVKEMGYDVFESCSLDQLIIPVNCYRPEALRYSVINQFILTGELQVVNSNYFPIHDCRIKSIVLPDTVIKIGKSAFEGLSDLESIILPDSLLYIDESAFAGCSALKTIKIPENVATIGTSAFSNCSKLVSCELPQKLTAITGSLFWECIKLEHIIIPADVEYIGNSAFHNCSSLKEIVIPEKVKEIKQNAFLIDNGNTSLLENLVLSGNPNIHDTNLSYLSSSKKLKTSMKTLNLLSKYSNFRNNCSDIEIISGENTIESYTFSDFKSLERLTLPESITVIEENAFYNCPKLEVINVPSNVLKIKSFAFYRCEKLTTVNLPLNLLSVGNNVFYDCGELGIINYEGTEDDWNILTNSKNLFYMCPPDIQINFNYTP